MSKRKARSLTIGGLFLIVGAVIVTYLVQAPSAGGAQVGKPVPEPSS